MTELDRRSFLGAFGIAAGAAMPEWLVRAFAIQESVSTWRTQHLRDAIERARKAEKPLLVLVVPNKKDDDVRGLWLGVWLEQRNDENMHLLASCELACATTGELSVVLGGTVDGAPMFVLVDVPQAGVDAASRVTSIECVIPAAPSTDEIYAKLSEEKSITEERKAVASARKAGLAAMDKAVQEGVVRHGLSLAEFASRAMRRLDDEQRQAIDAWFAGGKAPAAGVCVLGAAEIWQRVAAAPDRYEVQCKVLRRSVYQELVQREVPGARWYSDHCLGGFDTPNKSERAAQEKAEAEYLKELEALGDNPTREQLLALTEKTPGHIISCGRAVIPAIGQRFLEFWTVGD